jgi:hypothetical protein
MINIEDVIETIGTINMERHGVNFLEMCESEFEIYEWLEQPSGNERLTFCYYHRWICTDTQVGIRVWYYDDVPVCISWKPYRKSNEKFGWISTELFNKVKHYALSLISDNVECEITIMDNEIMSNVIEEFNSISHKKFEEKNIIK